VKIFFLRTLFQPWFGLRVGVCTLFLIYCLVLSGCGGGSSSAGGSGGGNPGDGGSGSSAPPAYPGNRTSFIRTGDTPSSAVYDSSHNLVFASEPNLGLVDAVSVPGGQIVARIPVPGVQALGLSADNSKILASTSLQQVAWIDTAGLDVVSWQTLPILTDPVLGTQFWVPFNYQSVLPEFANPSDLPTYAQNPYPLANGKVLFEALVGGSWPSVVEWDPVANTALRQTGLPTGGSVIANTAGTEVLFAGNPCFYDVLTDATRCSFNFTFSISIAAGNPAGTQFALFDGSNIVFIDQQFNTVGKVPLAAANSNEYQPTGIVYSPDGTRLYVVTPGALAIITTIDATNFSVVGTAPGFSTASPQTPLAIENPLTTDGTGLVIGAALGGLVFDDASDTYSFSQNDAATAATISPMEGPVQGGTIATVSSGISSGTPDVWFGGQLSTVENASALPQVKATSPPAKAAGPVDVKVIESTGVMMMIPDGFTYGSVPLLNAPLATAPAGGVDVDIYGFGFSADSGAATQQVSIGSGNAKVLTATQAEGIPVQDLTLTVPPGTPGPANIVVTSATGTATYPNGFRYLASVADYSSSDSLQAVLYDATRQQLYLNAGDHIDVFSLLTNSFSSAITPPSLNGTRQLQGMALTPDASKLLVGNFSDDSVSIIDPDNPAGAAAVQIAPAIGSLGVPQGPHGLATTSLGTAMVNVGTTNQLTGGGGTVYELNLATLKSTQRTDVPGILQVYGDPIGGSADGGRVFLAVPDNSGGNVTAWSAITDSWQTHSLGGASSLFLNDIAVARDGNLAAVNNDAADSDFSFPMFVDSALNQISQLGIESLFAAVNQPGMALHDSGALLYSSTDLGVDIIDVRHGTLSERIVLNEQSVGLSGSLAIDQAGGRIFLITNAGLTSIQLDAVPLSVGSITPSSGSSGALLQVRGSGFQAGTTAKIGNTGAAATFVDGDTLQLTIPTVASGPAALTLVNPDGTSYTWDAAIVVQ